MIDKELWNWIVYMSTYDVVSYVFCALCTYLMLATVLHKAAAFALAIVWPITLTALMVYSIGQMALKLL